MSHCPASGIAPHQPPVGRPREALLSRTSILEGAKAGQPACRSHSASWSMCRPRTLLTTASVGYPTNYEV